MCASILKQSRDLTEAFYVFNAIMKLDHQFLAIVNACKSKPMRLLVLIGEVGAYMQLD